MNGHKQGRTILTFTNGVLAGSVEAHQPNDKRCDYCGTPGCQWAAHEEAHADVAAWAREAEMEAHE